MKIALLIATSFLAAGAAFSQTSLDQKPRSAGRLATDSVKTVANPRADFFYMGTYYKGATLLSGSKDGFAQVRTSDNKVSLVPIAGLPAEFKAKAEADAAKAAQIQAAKEAREQKKRDRGTASATP